MPKLQLQLAGGRAGRLLIHWEHQQPGSDPLTVDMDMPWQVVERRPDGNARVSLGPPTFPGMARPPRWPRGATASFLLDPLDRDRAWDIVVPPDAEPGAAEGLRQALSPRYLTGVGIVRFPTTTVSVGEVWSLDDPHRGIRTHFEYRLVSGDHRHVRIAVAEESTVDGSSARETIRGEIDYALDQPLPLAGWLRIEARRSDGATISSRLRFGQGVTPPAR
jgi:hypothetical protein